MNKRGNPILIILVIIVVFALYLAQRPFQTLVELMRENAKLREAIGNLTTENVIGYATILKKEEKPDGPEITCRFVEVDRNDKRIPLSAKDFVIKGNEVFFDVLIVRFEPQLVIDGKERAIFLWRRVYGNKMKPEDGLEMNKQYVEAKRYQDLSAKLKLPEKDAFWKEIWDLSNDPKRLATHGIRGVNGHAVYSQFESGKNYKIVVGADGNLGIEVDLDPKSISPSDGSFQ